MAIVFVLAGCSVIADSPFDGLAGAWNGTGIVDAQEVRLHMMFDDAERLVVFHQRDQAGIPFSFSVSDYARMDSILTFTLTGADVRTPNAASTYDVRGTLSEKTNSISVPDWLSSQKFTLCKGEC